MRQVYQQQWRRQGKQGHILKFDSFIKEKEKKIKLTWIETEGRFPSETM